LEKLRKEKATGRFVKRTAVEEELLDELMADPEFLSSLEEFMAELE
jgi:hypothetical protein